MPVDLEIPEIISYDGRSLKEGIEESDVVECIIYSDWIVSARSWQIKKFRA